MVRLLSLNVRGLGNQRKRRAIFNYSRSRADIILLQETHGSSKTDQIWTNEWGGKALFANGQSNARGVCILVNRNFDCQLTNTVKDLNGRILITDITVNCMKLVIINVYAPNQDTPSFFQELGNMLQERSEHKVIMGDFNLTLDPVLDRYWPYNRTPPSNNDRARKELENLMNQYYLCEVWRMRHPQTQRFSWFKNLSDPMTQASRIDFTICSQGLDAKVENITYLPGIMTDHCAIFCAIKLEKNKRGVGYWKFNTLLLNCESFKQEIREMIVSIKAVEGDPLLKWETFKLKFKNIAQKASRRRASEQKLIISQLMEKIDELQQSFPLTQQQMEILNSSISELNEKTMEEAQKLIFRSRVKWYEQGEVNSRYFYNLEKARYNAKTCTELIYQNRTLSEDQDILEAQREFYEMLYTKNTAVNFEVQTVSPIQLTDAQKARMNEPYTEAEIINAMQGLHINKTPGKDGLQSEVYRTFVIELATLFNELVHHIFSTETLHDTASQGILNTIPKPGKDSRRIENLRPITLLNTDYKILEKLVMNRIVKTLDMLIHQDQRGFIPGRQISVNIRKLIDIMDILQKQEDSEVFVLSLDYSKAFDKVDFSAISGSLEYFNFPPYIIKWTEILYKNFKIQVQNNGKFSNFFAVNRGIHQGGVCSTAYFVLAVEIMAQDIRQDKEIEGVKIKDTETKLNQFADDTDSFSQFKQSSLDALLNKLSKYQKITGLEINYDKTTLYRIGSLRHSKAELYTQPSIKWTSETITVLGIKIFHDEEMLIQRNFNPLIEKSVHILNSWRNRNLSLLGRVNVINTLVCSLFIYKFTTLPPMPQSLRKKITHIMREYLWDGKKSKISFNTLTLSKKDGGLNLTNIELRECAVKCLWVKTLHDEVDMSKIVYHSIGNELGNFMWCCNLHRKDIYVFTKQANSFWKSVLETWFCFTYDKCESAFDQCIWFNSYIRIEDVPIFWPRYFKRGLIWISQLFEEKALISYDRAQYLFGMNYMDLLSLDAAIPEQWKREVEESNPREPDTMYHKCIRKKDLAAFIYAELNRSVGNQVYLKYSKWIEEINLDVSNEQFMKCFKAIYVTTNVPKMRSFQYRLLHRAVVTNKHLYQWGITTDNLCSLCRKEPETYSHLFVTCEHTAGILTAAQNISQKHSRDKDNLCFDFNNYLFNTVSKNKTDVSNFICLLAKQYIYRQRCLSKEVQVEGFIKYVYYFKSIEKFIAIKNSRVNKYCAKWAEQMYN